MLKLCVFTALFVKKQSVSARALCIIAYIPFLLNFFYNIIEVDPLTISVASGDFSMAKSGYESQGLI